MPIKQVWFSRPIHALRNSPTYIGNGPEWLGFEVKTGPGCVMVTRTMGTQAEKITINIPLENVLAFELGD